MTLALALAATITSMPANLLAQASKPNIVFILTDNLGYGEIGAYGGGVTRGAPTSRFMKSTGISGGSFTTAVRRFRNQNA